MKIKFTKICCVLALSPMLLAAHAMGALITWNTPTDVNTADPTQVSTTGTLFLAYTPSGFAPLNVNGVVFINSPSGLTVTPTGGAGHGGTGTGNYNDLLTVGVYTSNASSSTTAPFVISGLTAGLTYQVQIWTPFWDHNYMTAFSSSAPTSGASGSAPNESAFLNLGVSPLPPQFIIGTFTASGSTQNVYTVGSETYGIVGALQVRTVPVPEPQTWALAALGVSAVLFRVRRKQRGM